jgi:hypothetical protein
MHIIRLYTVVSTQASPLNYLIFTPHPQIEVSAHPDLLADLGNLAVIGSLEVTFPGLPLCTPMRYWPVP